MPPKTRQERVSISPGVSVLSVLSSLNYRPWFALGESVDNSIQSFLDYRQEIASVDGRKARLTVCIELDPNDDGRLTIRDNAAGIHQDCFPWAFRPAHIPPDRSGLCEFGMGMKSAACWFSPVWHVRTSALGEPTEKLVSFDIAEIVRDELEELDVEVRAAPRDTDFIGIILTKLHRLPVGKIKEHLAEICRVFIREKLLVLQFNGEKLAYAEPEVLVVPLYDANNQAVGAPVEWRKEIDFDFGEGLTAKGFAALRREGSTTHAGFSLFRRKRLVVGSADEKYRPGHVFGSPNDYVYQRLFGELHIAGFDVTHTKDGFQWDENEDPFLELLKEHLDAQPLPLLKQARNYRARPSRAVLRRAASQASESTSRSIERNAPPVLAAISTSPVEHTTPTSLPQAELASERVIDIEFQGRKWRIVLELSDDPSVGDWLEISEAVLREHKGSQSKRDQRELLGLRLSLAHPFMERFTGADRDRIEPVLRVAAAMGLAEKLAREGGVRLAAAVRRNVNKLLRDALSRVD